MNIEINMGRTNGKKLTMDMMQPIPCKVTQMDDITFSIGTNIGFPAFTIEAYPKTTDQVQQLLNYLNEGKDLNMSFEYRGLFLEKMLNIPKFEPERIIHSGPATIVFWNDKTKTVVKCSENDIYDEYEAFCAALAIKMFGSNSHLKKMIHDKTEERTPRKDIEVKIEADSLQKALNKLKKAFGAECQ